jgi:hypothetical protein
MSRALHRPYAEIVGLTGLEAYAVNAAVVRWGTAFQAAIEEAGANAKSRSEAEGKVQTVMRRWVPSTRKYR